MSGKYVTVTAEFRKYSDIIKSDKIDEVFKTIEVPEKFRNSYMKRKLVATKNGIISYKGTSSQNLSLIKLAKAGKLKRV